MAAYLHDAAPRSLVAIDVSSAQLLHNALTEDWFHAGGSPSENAWLRVARGNTHMAPRLHQACASQAPMLATHQLRPRVTIAIQHQAAVALVGVYRMHKHDRRELTSELHVPLARSNCLALQHEQRPDSEILCGRAGNSGNCLALQHEQRQDSVRLGRNIANWGGHRAKR
eukprot:CAMPEP_0195107512 /NCGR_PEP_ID=MMETSP0448-20130528/82124_1 /TAXON_ID=66468 /ORGANISM="Heterocapsa triquestra, Strain CCMP 448" /LENGTH=169 /DNA_ID=CAMNT_0040143955 /DNA_START=205 /DNA_END=710 /DNA_ORIENTATION=-